ncbi:glucose/quinate/shikimate family membrane-bound PQQ-dependent dehydrogenase (plasmid) [Tistrella mobilis]|uniref:glucose/quinate/shikimate family membrane-bound PQQ-dependent dehydrogenase n=1 Tax=Tistrella mobilis TaxID=171437 RepID=UPI00355862C2
MAEPTPQTRTRSRLITATAILFLLIALGLIGAGGWLVGLGGSWYYLAAGLGFLVTAWLLYRRRTAALHVYAAIMAGTLVWALVEVGFDWWQLAPRGDVIVVLGLWLWMPWITRRLGTRSLAPGGLPLAASLVLAVVVAGIAMATPSHGISGRLAMERVAELAPDYGGVPAGEGVPAGDWHAYGRTAAGQRYSPLGEITPRNVDRLEVAWTYHTGDMRRPGDPVETTYQVTPLKVDDTLYLCTPHNYVIALDAGTGRERWRFDPRVPDNINRQHLTCRGVSYHAREGADPATLCTRRIFMPTADARLIALDAATGRVCTGFGQNGQIDLWRGMPNVEPGFYYSTSPPVVTRDLLIIGGAVNDNVSVAEPSGVVRAYDVETGALVWNFDTGNPEATAPLPDGASYTANSPNVWSVASADEELGLVYLPIGNQPPDQWGGARSEAAERFSSSVTALDLASGRVRWVFQTVHHDLWDRDVPAQPTLVDLDMPALDLPGGPVPALVQPTKQGDLFVLDRRTGEPVLPVTEEPAPQGAAEGDHAAPTQPASALSFRPPPLAESDMWGATMFDQLACRIRYRSLDYRGAYTPPSERGTLVYPGNFGVFNWGGVAVDPERQVVFATPSYLAFVIRLIRRTDDERRYVSDGEPGLNENFGAPFAVDIGPMLSPVLGLPCQAPPWGYVAAADLRTGDIAWMHLNGTVRDRAPVPLPFEMGVPDLGGPLITAGGVAFMSGTIDYYVRAFDMATGRRLWEDRLPAGGQATPMSYRGPDGRQYLLVVAGGHGSLGTKAGDAIIAYALPPAGGGDEGG